MKILTVFILFTQVLFADPIIDWKTPRHKIVNQYLKIHEDFSQKLCKGSDHKYKKLYKAYNGGGFFIPVLNETRLDEKAIEDNLPLIKKKIAWIDNEIKTLKKIRSFKQAKSNLKKAEISFGKLLRYKGEFFKKSADQEKIVKQAAQELTSLRAIMQNIYTNVSFLMPFNFPVDHFEMRKEYDIFKNKESTQDQMRKNTIFFKRKVLEDGAQNPDHTRTDRFFRALLNTIEIQFEKEDAIISENFRYDFESILKQIKLNILKSKTYHLKRLNEWHARTERKLKFYTKLLNDKNLPETKDMLLKKSKAKFALKDFTLKKQEEVYKYWTKQPELMRALFSIETILFNEVGDIDGREALERTDVTQVIINRTQIPFYSSIGEESSIWAYLEDLGQEKINKHKWLNVLFKEGEFSFTYFFIPASHHVYCPDSTRNGRFIRKENLKIGLGLLKEPKTDFKAVRYFSRASMLGRIDMAEIWRDYKELLERPGSKTYKNRILTRYYKKKKYQFLYRFESVDGTTYEVVKIKKKAYVLDSSQMYFYNYRSPHFFTYFAPK